MPDGGGFLYRIAPWNPRFPVSGHIRLILRYTKTQEWFDADVVGARDGDALLLRFDLPAQSAWSGKCMSLTFAAQGEGFVFDGETFFNYP